MLNVQHVGDQIYSLLLFLSIGIKFQNNVIVFYELMILAFGAIRENR